MADIYPRCVKGPESNYTSETYGNDIYSATDSDSVWIFGKRLNTLDMLSYGVRWKPNVADPTLERVGNKAFHKDLPIQSGMKGCIYNPKEKKVVYWLDENDWKYKKGGNPNKGETEQLSRLDGYDGEVMVYVPEFYIRSWDEPDYREVRISATKVDDSWEYQPACYIAAYHDALLRQVPTDMGYLSTLPVNSAVSIVNNSTYCRGGGNDSQWDADSDIFKSNLGKPVSNLSRANFRPYARNANKEMISYRQYKNILYWLWVIEYATFNSQAPFNAELTSEGFHLGGMGDGVTTWDWNSWSNYNINNPLTPCGYTNEFGNGTGIKTMTLGTGKSFDVPRWRGIENNFGDIWSIIDGIIINSSSLTINGNKISEVYVTSNPDLYSDSNYQSMEKVGEELNSEGWIKEFDLGTTAEIIPRLNGGNVTLYKCDYHYVNLNTGLRILVLGGHANHGGRAGLGSFHSDWSPSNLDRRVGFRTSQSI